jgi:hypothetical protein
MWFQKLVEIDESEPEQMPRSVEILSEEPAATPSSLKIKRLRAPVVTPAEFQRVRLVSTLRKTAEREQSAEAYSHATKDWNIADVLYTKPNCQAKRKTNIICLDKRELHDRRWHGPLPCTEPRCPRQTIGGIYYVVSTADGLKKNLRDAHHRGAA